MKIEVFIAYTKSTLPELMVKTMEAWDTEEYEPVAILVKQQKYDLLRRVAAEGLAKADYLIADLGSKPGDETGIFTIKKGALKVEKWGQEVQ